MCSLLATQGQAVAEDHVLICGPTTGSVLRFMTHVATKGHKDAPLMPPPMDMLVFRAMLIWVACAGIWGHDDIWAQDALRAMCIAVRLCVDVHDFSKQRML